MNGPKGTHTEQMDLLIHIDAALECMEGLTDEDHKAKELALMNYAAIEMVYERALTMEELHSAVTDLFDIVLKRIGTAEIRAEMGVASSPEG